MRSKRLALLAIGLAVALAACEDPTNVGLGLIGEGGGEPEVVSLAVTDYAPFDFDDFSGGSIVPGDVNPTPRVLMGIVEDPLIGTITAVGHVDFSAVSGISEEFRAGTVSAAELLFTRDYVYGDTTSTLELEIRDIPDAWDARAPVDTTITTGGVVTTASVSADSRNVVIPLPDAWIDANSAVLRSTDFSSQFQGLALEGIGGNAVMGFSSLTARLRVVAAGDTVEYVANQALTTTTVDRTTNLETLIQDGTGVGLTLSLADSAVALGPSGVNGVVVRLPADTVLTMSQTPAGFVRPILGGLRLVLRVLDEREVVLDSFVADAVLDDGAYVWPVGALPETIFQDLLSGTDVELTVSAPPALFTINPVVLVPPDATADGPAVLLTLTSAAI